MGAFLEERIFGTVRYGARYSDAYKVGITETASDAEYRYLRHPFPRRRFTYDYVIDGSALYANLVSMWHRAYGRYAGFRVRCLDDFSSNNQTGTPTAIDQPMLRISAGVYQLQKRYGLGGSPLSVGFPVRTIFKPVAGSLLVAKNGILVGSGVTLDATTGRVSISPAPLVGDAMTAGFEFDIPCRFDSDLEIYQPNPVDRNVDSVALIELLNP